MKVLYDYQIFCEQVYGGVSRYVFELARYIQKRDDADVSILAPLYINKYLKNSTENIVIGFYIPKIPKLGRVIKSANSFFSKQLLKNKFSDIIHETYYKEKGDIKKNHKTKVVVTVHDMVLEKFPEYFPEAKVAIYKKHESIKRADHIICVSDNTRKDLLEMIDVNPEKVTMVHHGYERIIHSDINKSSIVSTPYILYIGQRFGYKNFTRLVKAFAISKIKNEFALVCFGGGRFSKNECKLFSSYGLSDTHIKYLSGEDEILENLYKFAAAFIYPSLYEGFGMPLLEAMSYQCPVLCSNTSSFPEIAGKAATYFDPYDVDSIANSMNDVLYKSNDEKLFPKIANENLSRFSWENCANSTMDVYSRII